MTEFIASLDTRNLERTLAAFQASLADFSEAQTRIADDFRELITEQFATEGRAGRTPWAPIAPSTARRRGRASPVLYSSGALFASLRDPGAPGHVEEADTRSLTLGSRLSYALYHQTGTRRMPARPIIVLSGGRVERWVEIVRQQIDKKTLRLGAKELGGTEL